MNKVYRCHPLLLLHHDVLFLALFFDVPKPQGPKPYLLARTVADGSDGPPL